MMKLAVASDHAGFPLKQYIVNYLREKGHDVLDLGVDTDKVRSDYSDAALEVANAINDGAAERGILLCGSGVGACIAANKVKGIYAAITHDTYSAAQGVEHDNMNVMVLGSRVIGPAVAETLLDAFVAAQFNTVEGRYERRFNKVRDIENGDTRVDE